jgi:hypothetical protein
MKCSSSVPLAVLWLLIECEASRLSALHFGKSVAKCRAALAKGKASSSGC